MTRSKFGAVSATTDVIRRAHSDEDRSQSFRFADARKAALRRAFRGTAADGAGPADQEISNAAAGRQAAMLTVILLAALSDPSTRDLAENAAFNDILARLPEEIAATDSDQLPDEIEGFR